MTLKNDRHFFFAHWKPLLRPRVFSRSLGCGARRGLRAYARRKFGPRSGSVARALGVRSRAICHVIARSLSAELEPTRAMETAQFDILASCSAADVL